MKSFQRLSTSFLIQKTKTFTELNHTGSFSSAANYGLLCVCGGECNKGRTFIFKVVKALGLKLLAQTSKTRFLVSVPEAHLK